MYISHIYLLRALTQNLYTSTLIVRSARILETSRHKVSLAVEIKIARLSQ